MTPEEQLANLRRRVERHEPDASYRAFALATPDDPPDINPPRKLASPLPVDCQIANLRDLYARDVIDLQAFEAGVSRALR